MQGYAVAACRSLAALVNVGSSCSGSGGSKGLSRSLSLSPVQQQLQWRCGADGMAAAAPMQQQQQQQRWSAAAQAFSGSASVQTSQNGAMAEEEDSRGVSYAPLQRMLQAGEWEAADGETRRLLIVLAGESAVKRKWVYYTEVQFIPEQDLKTIDSLWRQHSNGKFGYSVQRRIWNSVDQNYTRFFKKVAWTRPLNDKVDAYKKFPMEFSWDVNDPTPPGHLPLTNCLRGTQLLKNVLDHPAFAEADEEEASLVPKSTSDLKSLMGASSLKGLF